MIYHFPNDVSSGFFVLSVIDHALFSVVTVRAISLEKDLAVFFDPLNVNQLIQFISIHGRMLIRYQSTTKIKGGTAHETIVFSERLVQTFGRLKFSVSGNFLVPIRRLRRVPRPLRVLLRSRLTPATSGADHTESGLAVSPSRYGKRDGGG
jgi:hypothetical protein